VVNGNGQDGHGRLNDDPFQCVMVKTLPISFLCSWSPDHDAPVPVYTLRNFQFLLVWHGYNVIQRSCVPGPQTVILRWLLVPEFKLAEIPPKSVWRRMMRSLPR